MTTTAPGSLMGAGSHRGEVRPGLRQIIEHLQGAVPGLPTSAAKRAAVRAMKARDYHGDVLRLAVTLATNRPTVETYNPVTYADPTPAEAIANLDERGRVVA